MVDDMAIVNLLSDSNHLHHTMTFLEEVSDISAGIRSMLPGLILSWNTLNFHVRDG